jgi:hypothetical protein
MLYFILVILYYLIILLLYVNLSLNFNPDLNSILHYYPKKLNYQFLQFPVVFPNPQPFLFNLILFNQFFSRILLHDSLDCFLHFIQHLLDLIQFKHPNPNSNYYCPFIL